MSRIAVVDDEPDITETLKRGLQRSGFSVETFTDPESALKNFKPGMFDLMIIDIRMPKLNGFDLYRELRKKDGNVKVIFLTAFEIYYDEFRKLFPTIDVRSFVKKPVSIAKLVSDVNSSLAQGS
ncbi:MAG: response regulator [Nitrososphaera sp.]|jgi:DNA-binding response OmpR family regulator